MSFDTFTPPYRPSAGPSNYHEATRLLEAKFGDGYAQTVPDGINNLHMQPTLVWEALTMAEANAIVSFFRTHRGAPFYYTLPDEGIARKWIAKEWDRDFRNGTIGSVAVVLEERFDPD